MRLVLFLTMWRHSGRCLCRFDSCVGILLRNEVGRARWRCGKYFSSPENCAKSRAKRFLRCSLLLGFEILQFAKQNLIFQNQKNYCGFKNRVYVGCCCYCAVLGAWRAVDSYLLRQACHGLSTSTSINRRRHLRAQERLRCWRRREREQQISTLALAQNHE